MALTPAQQESYTAHIDAILSASDLTTISVKKVRNALQARLGDGVDLSGEVKKDVNSLIERRFDEVARVQKAEVKREEEESSHAGVKREALDDEDVKPAKKRKVSASHSDADADEKLAARLQAEENRSSRRTRGAATGAAKKKAVKKRVKKVKVESEPEYDSAGNEVKKVKKGAFHREYVLSEPLAVLVGDTQLSRPQVVKKIWAHIREHDLQVAGDRRNIRCDERMRAVFGKEQVHMFSMNKALSDHLYPLPEDAAGVAAAAEAKKGKKGKGEKEVNGKGKVKGKVNGGVGGKKSEEVVREEDEESDEVEMPTPEDSQEAAGRSELASEEE